MRRHEILFESHAFLKFCDAQQPEWHHLFGLYSGTAAVMILKLNNNHRTMVMKYCDFVRFSFDCDSYITTKGNIDINNYFICILHLVIKTWIMAPLIFLLSILEYFRLHSTFDDLRKHWY